ncbi:MAG TPA: hypothetical protein VLY24_06345 [Bryobacteraceae bacterium]|nr:hypothetical protein [Bryobacteraceae bacterium]
MDSCFRQGMIARDQEAAGKVFAYRREQTGVITIGSKVTADLNAWDQCTSCPEFDTCYRFSTGKLMMELAARN